MTIEDPQNFKELQEALLLADRTEIQEYEEYAENKDIEDRVTLLENRILILGVCLNKALTLLVERDGQSTN